MIADEQEVHFQRWLRDHVGLMLRVVRACAETQHDLLQDVLVNLWSSIPNFRGDSKETTWIYRVAFNTALVWQRGERRRQKHYAMFLNEAAATTQSSPDSERSGNELIERLYAAIRQLPKVDASLALMHLDGLSYQEMSEVLGISENYVGVKLTRIRQQLADQLQGVSDEL
ncbi:MAG: RNA polymerase sigma factor [Planctomycetales bacterium]|nr:RNA polymerase sigma factor [Planctomycetales bacterium]